MLVAKEERLKFLKQPDLHYHHVALENERLCQIRESAKKQELKLRRLRAQWSQANQQKINNSTLATELEQARALFSEKEKELFLAVTKIDELTHQFKEIRQRKLEIKENRYVNLPANCQLTKLRTELEYRSKLNDSMNAQLIVQQEALLQGREVIQNIDQKLVELQSRLHRIQLRNQQLEHQNSALLAKQSFHYEAGHIDGQKSHHPFRSKSLLPPTLPILSCTQLTSMTSIASKVKAADLGAVVFDPKTQNNNTNETISKNQVSDQNKEKTEGITS